jgi:hypothetical protein
MPSGVVRERASRARYIEDAIPWVGASAALVASIILDPADHPHKWHPAIMWTVCAFTCVTLFGRPRWTSKGFWLLALGFFAVHLVVMWALFEKLFPPRYILGTMYVAPIGFVEGIWILCLIGNLMGWSAKQKRKEDRRT